MRIASNRTLPKGALHVMTPVRTTTGINKAADAGRMDAQIRSTDAMRWIFPTTVASYLMARFAKRQQGTSSANCRLADVLSGAAPGSPDPAGGRGSTGSCAGTSPGWMVP